MQHCNTATPAPLTGVRSYKAATVNAYRAPIRAIVRAQGRMLEVKGVKQVSGPVETLDARDLGRLINAVDGPHWNDKRDVALVNVMARAGLRGSEALALKIGDVELGPRSGVLLVREGKGLKERTPALSDEEPGRHGDVGDDPGSRQHQRDHALSTPQCTTSTGNG